MSTVPVISVRGLTKSFGAVRAVADLTFDLEPATVTGFVGSNGSGKSTTIRMLLGLVTPTAGTASALGCPISDPRAYLSRVGALVESPAFYPQLTGHRNLLALARLARLPSTRIDEVLTVVGLAERARERYRDYSLGMKQRLGIAAALLQDPELLILDEPTNGLDPAGIVEMRAPSAEAGGDSEASRSSTRQRTRTGDFFFDATGVHPEVHPVGHDPR